jgi:hypothetical protein
VVFDTPCLLPAGMVGHCEFPIRHPKELNAVTVRASGLLYDHSDTRRACGPHERLLGRNAKRIGDRETVRKVARRIRERMASGDLRLGSSEDDTLESYASEWLKSLATISRRPRLPAGSVGQDVDLLDLQPNATPLNQNRACARWSPQNWKKCSGKVVSLNFASWNRVAKWLRQLEQLKGAA